MIQIKKLVWTEGNVEHIARHNVTKEEVEEVFHGIHIMKDAHGGRFMMIGPTMKNRALCIILDPEWPEGTWYIVTARSADRGERKKFTRETGVSL